MSSIPGELPRYTNVDGISFKKLFAPGHKAVFLQGQTIGANQQILPGMVLGRITAAGATQGHLVPCVKTATDGSQVPYAIAHRFIDTTAAGPAGVAAPQPAAVLGHGSVHINALILDASWGANLNAQWKEIEPLLRALNIFGVQQFYSY